MAALAQPAQRVPTSRPRAGTVRVVVRVKPLLGDRQCQAGSVLDVARYEPPPSAGVMSSACAATAEDAATEPLDVVTLTDARFTHPEVARFRFPAVYGGDTSQEALYAAEIRPVVRGVLRGGSACVFAYGPSGTGKTHSLQGPPSDPGIVPRVAAALFGAPRDVTLTLSFVEVYQERLYDLLRRRPAAGSGHTDGRPTTLSAAAAACRTPRATDTKPKPLKLLEGADGHVHVAGAKQVGAGAQGVQHRSRVAHSPRGCGALRPRPPAHLTRS